MSNEDVNEPVKRRATRYEQIGIRLLAIAYYCKNLQPGDRKHLEAYRQGDVPTSEEFHTIVSRYLLDFEDNKDDKRDYRDEGGPIIPVEGPAHFEAVQKWASIIALIARATPRSYHGILISMNQDLGKAMKRVGVRSLSFDRFIAGWPKKIQLTSIQNIVARFRSKARSFDLTPLAYGLLDPDASDIKVLQYQIARSYYLTPSQSQ